MKTKRKSSIPAIDARNGHAKVSKCGEPGPFGTCDLQRGHTGSHASMRPYDSPADVNLVIANTVAPPALLRLDLGCGSNKQAGFTGVDSIAFPGVDVVADLRGPWPWPDISVAEARSSHFIEHLTAMERVHFVNELHRVLVPGGKCLLIVPHWASCRAYGDPTHQWPPVSEFWFYYLSREWRFGNPAKGIAPNAPHTDAQYLAGGFSCDFAASWGYASHPEWQLRSQEAQQFAWQWYKEAIQDLHVTLTKAG